MSFTIKWNDPFVGLLHTVKFQDGWKRLNHCNAAVFYKRFEYEAGETKGHTDEWYFVSYASPVCKVTHYVNDTLKLDAGYDVEIDKDFHGWSVSSKKQLKKFLDNLHFFESVPLDYYEVMEALRDIEANDAKRKPISNDAYVFACTSEHISLVFDMNAPRYELHVKW